MIHRADSRTVYTTTVWGVRTYISLSRMVRRWKHVRPAKKKLARLKERRRLKWRAFCRTDMGKKLPLVVRGMVEKEVFYRMVRQVY